MSTSFKEVLLIIFVSCTLVLSAALAISWGESEQYPALLKVISVDGETVSAVNWRGDVYEFFGDDWCVGDYAAVIMDDNGTTGITDDKVVDTKYERIDLLGYYE